MNTLDHVKRWLAEHQGAAKRGPSNDVWAWELALRDVEEGLRLVREAGWHCDVPERQKGPAVMVFFYAPAINSEQAA